MQTSYPEVLDKPRELDYRVCRCAGAPSASAALSLISWKNYVMMKL